MNISFISTSSLSTESGANIADRQWYNDDEINLLFQQIFGNRPDITVLTAMLGNDWQAGNTLGEQLVLFNMRRVNNNIGHENVADRVIIPVNLGNAQGRGLHWVLLYIKYYRDLTQSPQITYIDPLGNPIPNVILNNLRNRNLFPGIKPIVSRIRLQTDGYNCGAWIVAAAQFIIEQEQQNNVVNVDDVLMHLQGSDIDGVRQGHRNILAMLNNINGAVANDIQERQKNLPKTESSEKKNEEKKPLPEQTQNAGLKLVQADELKTLATQSDNNGDDNTGSIVFAAEHGWWDIVAAIAAVQPASLGDPEEYGKALAYAACAQEWDICNTLLDANPSFEKDRLSKEDGLYSLNIFIVHNKVDLIKKYGKIQNANFNFRPDENYPTPLMIAATNAKVSEQTVAVLLSEMCKTGVYIAADTINLTTALDLAAEVGNIDKFRLILKCYQPLKTFYPVDGSNTGLTLIQLAAKMGHWDTVAAIIRIATASKGDPEYFGNALAYAAEARKWELCRNIINTNPSSERDFLENRTYSLHVFVANNRIDLIKQYRQVQGADFDYQFNEKAPTPLILAVKESAVTIATLIELLMQINQSGNNALKIALAKNQGGQTALDFAIETQQNEKMDLLIKCIELLNKDSFKGEQKKDENNVRPLTAVQVVQNMLLEMRNQLTNNSNNQHEEKEVPSNCRYYGGL